MSSRDPHWGRQMLWIRYEYVILTVRTSVERHVSDSWISCKFLCCIECTSSDYCYQCARCLSVSLSVSLSVCHVASLLSASLCGGHSVQPLPNHLGLLSLGLDVTKSSRSWRVISVNARPSLSVCCLSCIIINAAYTVLGDLLIYSWLLSDWSCVFHVARTAAQLRRQSQVSRFEEDLSSYRRQQAAGHNYCVLLFSLLLSFCTVVLCKLIHHWYLWYLWRTTCSSSYSFHKAKDRSTMF